MLTVHVPWELVVQPVQPVNREPLAATAVRVAVALALRRAEQVDPQSIPAGALVTVPAPSPVLLTDSWNWLGASLVHESGVLLSLKLAAMQMSLVILTEQVFVEPLQAPVQALRLPLI
jgi:hypothetical protein